MKKGDVVYKCKNTDVRRYVIKDIRKAGGVTLMCYLIDNLGKEYTIDDFSISNGYSKTKEEAIIKEIESLTYKIDIQNNDLNILTNNKIILEGMLDEKV